LGDYRLIVSAGASGAIFGVIGGLLYAVVVNRGRLEDLSTRQLVVVIVCSLYFGFSSTGVDNAAHIAGLFVGILMGIVLYRKPKRPGRMENWE
ncbi:rhomboid family intramembrane serine protease, partial [Clostridium perfringens]|nr:rhomboid family intramembrane serine protease [Clostridium perfringens]